MKERADSFEVAIGQGPQADDALTRLAAIVESLDAAMIAVDLDGSITMWNAGAERIYGYAAREVLGRSMGILDPPQRPLDEHRLLARVGRGERIGHVRVVGRHKQGHPIHVSLSMTPIRNASGQVIGATTMVREVEAGSGDSTSDADVTQRESVLRGALTALRKSHEDLKAAQLQLIQSAKLESIGRLAAGVAHEVKNPLAIILSGAEYLKSRLSPEEHSDIDSALGDIQQAVRRATGVIAGLLDFSAATELTPEICDVSEVVDQALSLVKHAMARNRVTVVRNVAPDVPRVMLDRTKMEQVFVNLFINAADAMPDGGTITVKLYKKQLGADMGGVVGYRRTDEFHVGQTAVFAEVEDTGTGIDKKHLQRLFDPFFTTKPTGKGTGLGLAVTKTIVALHGGTVRIENRPEGGVRAVVLLKSARLQEDQPKARG